MSRLTQRNPNRAMSFFDDTQRHIPGRHDDTPIPPEFAVHLYTAIHNGAYRQHVEQGGNLSSFFADWYDNERDDNDDANDA